MLIYSLLIIQTMTRGRETNNFFLTALLTNKMNTPACTEMVSYWIADTPMKISRDQLYQMKAILFTNVNKVCKRTCVHNDDHSVARPIQPTNRRKVYRCTEDDFGPDDEHSSKPNN